MKFSALALAFAPLVSATVEEKWEYEGTSGFNTCPNLDTLTTTGVLTGETNPGDYFFGAKLVNKALDDTMYDQEGCHDTNGFVPILDGNWFEKDEISSCSTVNLNDVEVQITCVDCELVTNEDNKQTNECKSANIDIQSISNGAPIAHLEVDLGFKGGDNPGGILYDIVPEGASGLTTCLSPPCQGISHINFCFECTAPPPPPPGPGMSGDPHIKSWTGEWFDYHGECDLELVHVPKFDGWNDLDIHVRTTIQFEKYSFIEAAAVKIGNDILEVGGWGEYALNGVEDAIKFTNQGSNLLRKAQSVTSLGGYRVYHTMPNHKKHTFDIVISETENITISNFKEWVNVRLESPNPERYQKVEGVLGNYQGKMVARDGVTDLSGDMNAFGQEWQVTDEQPMLFRTARAPQYPQTCRLPTSTTGSDARRLGESISDEAAEAACAHLKKNEDAFAACVFDVQAMNDLEAASSGAY